MLFPLPFTDIDHMPRGSQGVHLTATTVTKALRVRSWSARKIKRVVFTILIYFILINLAFVFFYPFLKTFIHSLKSPEDLLDVTVTWIPQRPTLVNYQYASVALDLLRHLANSVLLAIIPTVGAVFSASFVGYGFARYRFKGREILFGLVLLTLIVPPQSVIIPLYELYNSFGWLSTEHPLLSWLPLIVPSFFSNGLMGGLFVFLFRQNYRGVPVELEEAARLDGCGMFKCYWYVAFPLSGSCMLVSSILSIVWQWNDYFKPRVFIVLKDMYTLPMMLSNIFNNYFSSVENAYSTYTSAVVSAASVLVMIPMVVFYLVIQRFFMKGIERTGLVG